MSQKITQFMLNLVTRCIGGLKRERELFKILKTIVDITNHFISENSPYALLFFGVSKDGSLLGDKQKNSLYLSIMNQNLPTGYRLSKATIEGDGINGKLDGYVLFKN
jgi:hypothetical protein